MGLSRDDQRKLLLPSWLYYGQKIARESMKMEPELRILRDIVPAGRIAIDVGANRGFYSYALSWITDRVEAFEPNPTLAAFARKKLGPKIPVREVALSNHSGTAKFFIPQLGAGNDCHFNASLKKVYPFEDYVEIEVPVARLDEFGFADVGFIKIDTEGSDLDVVEGARQTISRDRPNLLVELVAVTHADPSACIEQVKESFRYDAWIMVGGRPVEARAALREAHRLKTCNVLFTPR